MRIKTRWRAKASTAEREGRGSGLLPRSPFLGNQKVIEDLPLVLCDAYLRPVLYGEQPRQNSVALLAVCGDKVDRDLWIARAEAAGFAAAIMCTTGDSVTGALDPLSARDAGSSALSSFGPGWDGAHLDRYGWTADLSTDDLILVQHHQLGKPVLLDSRGTWSATNERRAGPSAGSQ